MKKITALLVLCLFALKAFNQSPYTITTANFPFYGLQLFDRTLSPTGTNLTPAANGTWDFSAFHTADTIASYYVTETDPYYTNAGIDVYISDFKLMNANLGYYIYYEFDFNNTGVYEKGHYVDEQHYGISAITGNTKDSLTFPLQGAIYGSGRQVMQFPASYQSGWHSQSRRVVNFNLTVTAAGLNKAPCQHAFNVFRSDTIIGWGNMRVYTNGHPSIQYNVLIDKSVQYAIDSFYVNGAPAPAILLNAFGVTQGQQSSFNNRYTVYRQGNSTPLAIFNYGTNNFTTPSAMYFDDDNLTPTTGVKTLNDDSYTTLLFPNPSSSGVLNLQITGNIPALDSYLIMDMQGRTVQSGSAQLENGLLHLELNSQLPNGNYVLQVLNDKKQTAITEPFVVQH